MKRVTIVELIRLSGHWYGGERPRSEYYVDPNARGRNTGKSWGNAFLSLRQAIDAIPEGELQVPVSVFCRGGADTTPVTINKSVTIKGNYPEPLQIVPRLETWDIGKVNYYKGRRAKR